jgi:hypothetical protein
MAAIGKADPPAAPSRALAAPVIHRHEHVLERGVMAAGERTERRCPPSRRAGARDLLVQARDGRDWQNSRCRRAVEPATSLSNVDAARTAP